MRPPFDFPEHPMRTALVIAVVLVSSAAAIAADTPTEARTLLDRYYADLLLKDGTKESLTQAARLFANPALPTARPHGRAVFAACATAGLTEPYRFYRPLLDNDNDHIPYFDEKGKKTGVAYFNPTEAAETAQQIVDEFAANDPAVKKIKSDHLKTADQIPHLKKWLDARFGKKE
jgi:hypothetical protein